MTPSFFKRFILGIVLVCALTGSAVDTSFIKTGGLWSASGNWTGGNLPGPTTNVFITNNIQFLGNAFTVTNDVSTPFGDLTISNATAIAAKTLLLNADLNPEGNILVGRGSVIKINGRTISGSGMMTITNGGQLFGAGVVSNSISTFSSNGGSAINAVVVDGSALSLVGGLYNASGLLITSNAVMNVGATTAAGAMTSGMVLTNASDGSIRLGVAGRAGTLNANSNGIGILNLGSIGATALNATGIVNATFFNGASGVVSNFQNTSLLVFHAFPTNEGLIRISRGNTLIISNGGLVNASGGRIDNMMASGEAATTLDLLSAPLINNGEMLVGGSSLYKTPLWVNNGLLVLSNLSSSATMVSVGPSAAVPNSTVSNAGTLVLLRAAPIQSGTRMLNTTNLVNSGTILAMGNVDGISRTNAVLSLGGAPGANPVANLSSGSLIATNGGHLGFDALANSGTVIAYSNSSVSVGLAFATIATNGMVLGANSLFTNNGTISLQAGTFGAAYVANAAGATLRGFGDVGTVTFTNLVGGISSDWVRNLAVAAVANQGTIAPDGVLNVSVISNLSGGLILGKGTLTSFNVTNFYDIGDNLVTSNLEVGAKIVNATGGTILASGETLVLKNGFSANTQAGMIGTTNGGTLRLGDGTLALTNSGTGTVRLQGGALQLGSLVNEGSLVGAGAVQAASVISSGLLSPGFSPGTLSFSNDLTLTVAAQLVFEIAGTNALAYDRLLIGGAFAKAGTVLVTNLGWGFAAGDTFDFFEAGSLSGSFTSMLPLPDLAGGLTWDTTLFESHGIMSVVGVIPEPGVVSLLLLASAGFLVFRQRRK